MFFKKILSPAIAHKKVIQHLKVRKTLTCPPPKKNCPTPPRLKKKMVRPLEETELTMLSCETGVTMTESLPPLCPPLQTSPPLRGTTYHPLWTEQHKGGLEILMLHQPVQLTSLRLYRTSPKDFPWYLSMYGPLERQKIEKYAAIVYQANPKRRGLFYVFLARQTWHDAIKHKVRFEEKRRGTVVCSFLVRYSLARLLIFHWDWLHFFHFHWLWKKFSSL